MKEGGRRGDKKGQVTIFVILAIVLIALIALAYLFYPEISSRISTNIDNPSAFIQSCLEEEITETVSTLSIQGGFLEPAPFILHEGEKIQYLCYTENYYDTCVVQKPLLTRQIEKEIKEGIKNQADDCFEQLKEGYENRGYETSFEYGTYEVQLLPKRIFITFNHTLNVERTDSQRFEDFSVSVNNNLFELISIADSIIDLESIYGDATSQLYMDLYHDLKVQKREPEYGTTLYILTDRPTGNIFQFASRSVVFPPGTYGYDLEQFN